MRIVVIACGLALLALTPAAAQPRAPAAVLADPASARFQLGFGGLIGVPVGEFDDNVGISGGLAADFGYRLDETPISLGVVFGALWYGGERRRVPLSLTIPDVLVDVNTRNYMLQFHGRVRVQPRHGRVRPYADGLVGFNYLFTQTTVGTDQGGFQDQSIARTTNLDDLAPSVGGGGGMMIDLVSGPDSRLGLDFGLRYLRGSEANYLTEGSIRRADGSATLDVSRSRTDLVEIQLGLAFDF